MNKSENIIRTSASTKRKNSARKRNRRRRKKKTNRRKRRRHSTTTLSEARTYAHCSQNNLQNRSFDDYKNTSILFRTHTTGSRRCSAYSIGNSLSSRRVHGCYLTNGGYLWRYRPLNGNTRNSHNFQAENSYRHTFHFPTGPELTENFLQSRRSYQGNNYN